jgi:oligopeptide/dipeptide ABC transporter ATP-binding protein
MSNAAARDTEPLVSVKGLVRHFQRRRRHPFDRPDMVHAVDGIDFDIARGETFSIVGESGCGKSTTARLVLGIDAPTSGSVTFENRDISNLADEDWRALRTDLQMIFQDPMGALDPRMTAEQQVREPLDIHNIGDAAERERKVSEAFDAVSLADVIRSRFPHELSGGQQQRVVIARALILEPKLVVCDEPISALDVSVQAQVVNLLSKLQEERGLSYLFISHDLKVVRYISDRVAVMYLGEIVETGSRDALFGKPLHPYTQALISAIPIPDPDAKHERIILEGDPPSPVSPPSGCRFHTRCPYAEAVCAETKPELGATDDGRKVACHIVTGLIQPRGEKK